VPGSRLATPFNGREFIQLVVHPRYFLAFFGFRERDFALHRGQMGAFLWMCWWQDAHCWNRTI